MNQRLNSLALAYHKYPAPGKLSIQPTKPMANQSDLALAYSPGVAAACQAIADNPSAAADYTARANLVAVVSNGTAVLGMGNIGPLAAKPVMEGKAVLFKKFANIDAFDIELDELDLDALVETIARLEPTFGGINLEDFKAPECFELERRLQKRMAIPVFHDDQHGTAIVVAAAMLNALSLTGKKIESVRLVTSGAGAAAIACLDLLVTLGLRKDNITITDVEGVVFHGRPNLSDPDKTRYAAHTPHRTLAEALVGADVFLGLSVGNIVSRSMIANMAPQPLVFALANPIPEIDPLEVKAERPDAIFATGRSDYKNQINNLLCFPFIFRGALDVGATTINTPMKLACVKALASLAHQGGVDSLFQAFTGESFAFGADYIIPKPFDPRLLPNLAAAVAMAAQESGVATRPITDLGAYSMRLRLQGRPTASWFAGDDFTQASKRAPVICVQSEEPILQACAVVGNLQQPLFVCDHDGQGLQALQRFGLETPHNIQFFSSWEKAQENLGSGMHARPSILMTSSQHVTHAAAGMRALFGDQLPTPSLTEQEIEDKGFFDLYIAGEQAWALCGSEVALTTPDDLIALGAAAVRRLEGLSRNPRFVDLDGDAADEFRRQVYRSLVERYPRLQSLPEDGLSKKKITHMVLCQDTREFQRATALIASVNAAHKIGSLSLSQKALLGVCAPNYADIVDMLMILSAHLQNSPRSQQGQ